MYMCVGFPHSILYVHRSIWNAETIMHGFFHIYPNGDNICTISSVYT